MTLGLDALQAIGTRKGWLRRPDAVRAWPPRGLATSVLDSLWGSLKKAVEDRRLFILLPFVMIAGMAFYAALPFEPPRLLLAGGAVLSAIVIVAALWQQNLSALRIGIQAVAFWLGLCLLPLHAMAFGTQMLSLPAYGTYSMQVDQIISSGDGQRRVIVSSIVPEAGSRAVPIRRARLLLPDDIPVHPGDVLKASVRFAPVPGPVLPGTYDGQFHSYFAGIGAYGTATSGIEVVARADPLNVARQVQALRDMIGKRLDAVLTGDTAAIGKAMVVGDQSGITDQTRDLMAASGLAHIYSISGLHLSIVAGGIFWLVRLVLASIPALVGWPVKKIAAVVGVVAAFLYLLLAGGVSNVPALRSTLMLALVFGAVLAGRRALTMRNVAIAAIAIVLIDPASVFRPSFQLSFAAVVGLIGVYELPQPERRPGGKLAKINRLVLTTAWTSLIAGFATLLFSAYHFQQTSPLGVLGNVMALPFVSFIIMPFGVLAVLAMPLGIDAPLIAIMGWGIDRMVDVAELVAGWSAGITGNPLLAGWTLMAGLAALAWFAFIGSRWRLLGPLVALPLILVVGFEPRPDVLIADSTQAVAVRDGDGLALASGKVGSFAVDVWSRHYQTPIGQTHSGTQCDKLGCIVRTEAFSLAVVRNAAAFAEDCGAHDLLIARVDPPTSCYRSGPVIGPGELKRGGVHWLRWNEAAGRFDIRPAIENLRRPWRASPR